MSSGLEDRKVSLPEVDGEPTKHARPGIGTRLISLTALVGVGGGLAWLVASLVGLFSDSWIAPIELSPESDAVINLDLQLTRQRAEMQRVEAELERIESEIAAIDAGIERLSALRERSRDLFDWGAEVQGEEASTLGHSIRDLREEREIILRLLERQREETERARAQLAAGLVERRDVALQEQSLDRLELQRVANARALAESEVRRRRAHTSAGIFRESMAREARAAARMPEIVQRHEQETRLELEILRLQAERRGLVAMREVGQRTLAELGEVMTEIEARPLYRATQTRMDVAFVPYEQLDGVAPGAEVVHCEAGIFFCRPVGSVSEVLPGEVVTQDPWGELARGRYAVLELHDREAVRERILRVHGG